MATSDLYARLQMQGRVEQARGEQILKQLRRARSGNNPYSAPDEYVPRSHSDPTADAAIANADRDRRRSVRPGRR